MTVKDKVLNLLEYSKGIYYSGEGIANELNVSRAAVWKAVKALRSEGYQIDAVNNRGYRMSSDTDILSPQGIHKYMVDYSEKVKIHVIDSSESTNSTVRQQANHAAPEGYTVIAKSQTGGRGRNGRTFYSPAGTGIYMSILLRPPKWTPKQAVQLTTMAAVAMCDAIGKFSKDIPKIKWVNDIIMNGKKVCGILTEGSFSMESGLLDFAVLGLGVNIYTPENGFPDELSSIAGPVFSHPVQDIKNKLAAEFLQCFFRYYHSNHPETYVKKYRNYSLVIGKEVLVMGHNVPKKAYVDDIDSECRLLVTYEDGKKDCLSYGEISLKVL